MRSRNRFEEVYKNGKKISSTDRKVKAVFLISSKKSENLVNIAVTVSSKSGNSIWRNRFKRLIKELLKSEINFLAEIASQKGLELMVVFSPFEINQAGNKKLSVDDVRPAVSDLLSNIKKAIYIN
jgi:ribonuclease P protein component